jgi:trans-2,3-dihydro-3-hydroxyanthranilate isomerase
VPIVSLEAIARAQMDASSLARLFQSSQPINVAVITEQVTDPAARVHTRMFSSHLGGNIEDAATGSMAAPLGAYLARHGRLPGEPRTTFLIEQGLEMQRPSQITVEVGRAIGEIQSIRIGGDSVIVGEGEIYWE